MIRRALLAEEERKRVGRENFPMTTVPVTQLAAYEPALHSAVEEHEEGSSVIASLLLTTLGDFSLSLIRSLFSLYL
jgi:hypothetical protein